MPGLSDYQQLIEQHIRELKFPNDPPELYEPVQYMMSLGGKRIRPLLCLMACDLFGGDTKAALKPALAMEVFHNFTLIHDDLMDKAELRRGKQTVHHKWNMSTAVLSGDVMLVLAYDLLTEADKDKFRDIILLFNDTARKVCEGQQMDMVFEQAEQVSIADYVKMIGLKTAALLAGSLKMGALLAGAAEEDQILIYDFGYTIGTAFQIQDDLLDSFGGEAFGKAIGGDIAANKKTYLTLKAFELADNETAKGLAEYYGLQGHKPENKIKAVLDIYRELNIKVETEKARDKYFDHAMHCLEGLHADPHKKELLRKLAADLINRQK